MTSQVNASLPSETKQLSEHQQKVLEQYNSSQGLQFYQTVMGDFGFNIHYGIYENPYETVAKASENVIRFLVALIQKRVDLGTEHHVIDLGSGNGGAAHYLALNYGCKVTCINICTEQNKQNYLRAQELGVTHLINIVECSFEQLPDNWDNYFDIVWSEEAFCHAQDKHKVIQEAKRVLVPGGVCVFTDLMCGESSSSDDVTTFSDRNAVTGLARVSEYIKWISSEGLKNFQYYDFTSHLAFNFQKMIDHIDLFWNEMTEGSVSQEYLDQFRQSLVNRLEALQKGAFAWGCFYMTKALNITSPKLQMIIAERNIISVPVQPLTQENVGDLGILFANEEVDEIQVPLVQWTSPTGRDMPDGNGMGTLVTGDMTVAWDAESLSAYNQALDYQCRNLAYRDRQGNIYLEWFNRHDDGGQAFLCPGKKLLYILAPPVANPRSKDFQAFVSDGNHGIILQPGVWHTNPIPLADNQVIITTQQCKLDATVDCHLASEDLSWLKIRIA